MALLLCLVPTVTLGSAHKYIPALDPDHNILAKCLLDGPLLEFDSHRYTQTTTPRSDTRHAQDSSSSKTQSLMYVA